jgi:hypothetical protein
MPRKCMICGENAVYSIKDSSDFYCEECAKESFSDTELLEKLEDRAKAIKKLVDERIDDIEGENKNFESDYATDDEYNEDENKNQYSEEK